MAIEYTGLTAEKIVEKQELEQKLSDLQTAFTDLATERANEITPLKDAYEDRVETITQSYATKLDSISAEIDRVNEEIKAIKGTVVIS